MAYGSDKTDKSWVVLSVQVPQPAAGADWSVTVPTRCVWKIKAIFAQLVCSSTVATRNPNIVYDDGTNPLVVAGTTSNGFTASSNNYISAWPNAQVIGSTGGSGINHGVQELPIPADVVLPDGFRIRSSTNSIQAADQWQTISLLVEQADAY